MSEGQALSDYLEAMGAGEIVVDYTEKMAMLKRYKLNAQVKVGNKIKCACCGRTTLKKSYQSQFCSNKGPRNCKDYFWNRVDRTRFNRALSFVEIVEVEY